MAFVSYAALCRMSYYCAIVFYTHFIVLFTVNLDVIPVGADAVKIWGVEAELFLMIDDAGLLRATVSSFTLISS